MYGAPLFRLTALEGPLLAGASTALITWRWPRAGIVRALSMGVESGVLADLQGLELGVTLRGEHLTTSGRSVERLPGLLAVGEQWWHPLGIPVGATDPWAIQLTNVGLNTIEPRLFFWLDPPPEKR